jgi:hypothetical protein
MVSPIASILHRIQKKSGKCHYGNIFPYIFFVVNPLGTILVISKEVLKSALAVTSAMMGLCCYTNQSPCRKPGGALLINFFHQIIFCTQRENPVVLRLFDGARFDGMGINHRSANIGVSQQFLNGADGVIGPLAVALF